jgi:Flp pilus assembly protein TadG
MRGSSRFSPGSRRGNAAVEMGLLLPWIVISFLAVIDFGFSAYGLIATQNAARIGAAWGSATSANAQSASFSTKACAYAIEALRYAPNVGTSITSCGGASPVSVTASYNSSGADQLPTVSVSVSYKLNLLAAPGVSGSNLTITRTVQLPVRN